MPPDWNGDSLGNVSAFVRDSRKSWLAVAKDISERQRVCSRAIACDWLLWRKILSFPRADARYNFFAAFPINDTLGKRDISRSSDFRRWQCVMSILYHLWYETTCKQRDSLFITSPVMIFSKRNWRFNHAKRRDIKIIYLPRLRSRSRKWKLYVFRCTKTKTDEDWFHVRRGD